MHTDNTKRAKYFTTLSNELCHAQYKNRESNRNNRNRKKYVNESNRKKLNVKPSPIGLSSVYIRIDHVTYHALFIKSPDISTIYDWLSTIFRNPCISQN